MTIQEKYAFWLNSEVFDEKTKEELRAIADDPKEIEDRFYKDLEFGTGGLRGILGAGSNRMNTYTVRKATQGLANFIIGEQAEEAAVVIAYDSRRRSQEFAYEAARCLAANRIKAYVFESLRPTPELSFAVRELGCIAGIVITASHNPPEYNGYKVYWEDGGQITPPKDKQIIACVNEVIDYGSIPTMQQEEAVKAGYLQLIGEEIDKRYIEELKKLVENPKVVKDYGEKLKIVYTPLHGTGNLPVRRILQELGFTHVYVVPEQEGPDGDFPTVSYPNPEDAKAFTLALKLAREKSADLVLATDPDADRLGIYARDAKTGEYMPFTGNMSGMLICEYLLSQKKAKETLPANGAIVKTIVTTAMARAVAKNYGLHLVETLTGFKYIGEQIKLFEQEQNFTYVFGLEESYGCLLGTYARDKDAVAAVMALCEAAAYYRSQNMTLWDQMMVMYEKYGYYQEGLKTITLKGAQGAAKIQSIMQRFREKPLQEIRGNIVFQVQTMRDYQSGQAYNLQTDKEEKLVLPSSNVLYYTLLAKTDKSLKSDTDKEQEANAWFCVRPSGTEPKMKFYLGVKGDTYIEAKELLKDLEQALDLLLQKM